MSASRRCSTQRGLVNRRRAVAVCVALGAALESFSATAQTLEIADVAMAEGSSDGSVGRTAFVFAVELSAPAGAPVDVEYDVLPGGGPFPADLGVDLDLAGIEDTLPIPPGETEASITVPVVADLEFENVEFFRVELRDPVNATIDPLGFRGVGQIQNDDLYVTVSSAQVAEGNDGTTDALFSIGVAGCSSPPCTPAFDIEVDYSAAEHVPSSATGGVDFQAVNGSLSFPAGVPATAATVPVPVVGDLVWEPSETFRLLLVDVRRASGTDTEGAAMILNDDVRFQIASYQDLEGSSGPNPFAIPVVLVDCGQATCTYDRDLSVELATAGSGSAIGGSDCGDPSTDYVEDVVAVVVPQGSPSSTASLVICGETALELDDTFVIQLQNASNGSIQGTGAAIVTILNDDEPPPVVPVAGWLVALTGLLLLGVGIGATRRRRS